MKVTDKRYFNTTCHIVSFMPPELRLEPHNGIPEKRENIHYIWGAPNLDEVTALKATGPFFDSPNSKSEMLGAELQKVEIQYKGTRTRTASSGRDYYDMHSFTGSTGTLIIEPVYMDNPDELEKLNMEKISQAYTTGFKKFIQEYYINTLC
jgi:N-acetylmuramoyl-L-alanine amidase